MTPISASSHAVPGNFAVTVLRGLARSHKRIPCKYLYDARGVALFQAICDLKEYYLTRSELMLLERHGPDIARLAGPRARVVEFGGCSGTKARRLLAALDAPAAYVPVDLAHDALLAAAAIITREQPALTVIPLHADFMRGLTLPLLAGGRVLGFFPGSSIGNLSPHQAVVFLDRAVRSLGPGCDMLVGVDMRKRPETLEAAYNDPAGVSAAFNLNLLMRINRELDGDLELERFEHQARWNGRESRIEIDIVSRRAQTARIAGRVFRFGRREPIRTECCYKWTVEDMHWLAGQAGFTPLAAWVGGEQPFTLHYLRHGGG